MKTLFTTLLILIMTITVWSQDRLTGQTFTTRSEVLSKNGMAATSQPLATQAALQILQKGGYAMDAAIAANAVLGLVEPASCRVLTKIQHLNFLWNRLIIENYLTRNC